VDTELKAVVDTFENSYNKLYSKQPALVYWLTDTENLVGWLQKGSRKVYVQEDLLALFQIATRMNLTIIPMHVPRDYAVLQLGDLGSKWQDTDDWSIDAWSFSKIQ